MKIILLFLLLIIFSCSYGQTKLAQNSLTKEDYLHMSKRQSTFYWITGGAAALFFTIGAIMYFSEYGNGLPGGTGYNEKVSKTGEALMYAGGGLTLVSISFRIASKRNKKIAASLSLKANPIPSLQDQEIVAQFAPMQSLKITFIK